MTGKISIVRTLILIVALVGAASLAEAGTISNISVSQDSTETTVITTYTFTFTPATTISGSGDGRYFWFNFDDDYTVSGAVLESITPSVSGMAINDRNDSNGEIRMFSGTSSTITGGQQYVVVLSGIQNPAVAQTPVAHQIRTGDGSSTVDTGTVAAATITAAASNPPVVQSQIPDKSNLLESQGQIQYVANLNNHFLDSDGDTITYSAESSNPTVVAVSLSGTNNRILSLQAHRFGSADITVTATSDGGSVDDEFNVTAIGLLPVNGVTQGSTETTTFTSYSFTFTPETSINDLMWCDGAYFFFDLDDDFTVSGATLGSITPSVAGMAINFTSNATGQIRMYTNSGSITGGQQYTVVINNIQNPSTAQTPVAHSVSTGEGCGTVDVGSIAAAAITEAVTNPPVVSTPIPDKNGLSSSEGEIIHVMDLNGNFEDVDGDTMTFSAVSSDPTTVAVSTTGTNGQILRLEAFKYGSTTITVTATSVDGNVDDEFTVTTAGTLVLDDVIQATNEANAISSYTFVFTPDTTINSGMWCDGAYFFIDFDDDFTVSGSTLVSISPSVAGMTINGRFDSTGGIRMFSSSGQIIGNQQYTVVIDGVQNPPDSQQPDDYRVATGEGCGQIDAGAAVESGSLPAAPIVPKLGDFNGDGNADLLWRHYGDGSIAMWFMDNAVVSGTTPIQAVVDLQWRIEGMADFDDDGDLDIVWRHYGNGGNAVWFLDGSTVTGSAPLPGVVDTRWEIAGAADFDGDGDGDILWRHLDSFDSAVWLMDGTTFVSAPTIPAVTDSAWHLAGAVDFSGDGRPDLVWRNYSTGENAVWFMNGTTFTGATQITPVYDLNWRIEAFDDFDGDGHTDIVWRHYGDGGVAYWYFNGTTMTGSAGLPGVLDLNWNIVAP